MKRRTGVGGVLRRWGDALATCGAALVVLAPAFVSSSGVSPDFVNHLWLVRIQELAFHAHAWPSYFVNASGTGVFFPMFLFYGGTLYAAVGALADLSAHVRAAFFLSTWLAVVAAYGGLLWLSRQLGARGWRAHAPSVVFVASAYYITNLWGRGDWPEFMATSMVPLLVASAWRVASAPRLEPAPAFLLILATVFFAGSHNVTLVLGALVLVGLLIVLAIALGRDLLPCGTKRLAALGGLLLIGVGLDAWFLLPDVLHGQQTRIGGAILTPWAETGFLSTPGVMFDPFRTVPAQSTTPALFVQAPDWFLAWIIAAAAVLWTRVGRATRRAMIALVSLLLALLAVIMIGPLWDAMPKLLRQVQFPYRVNTYVTLCVAALVLLWILAIERIPVGRRYAALNGTLAAAAVITIALGVWQVWYRPRDPIFYYNLNSAYVPISQAPAPFPITSLDYADRSQRVVPTAPTANVVIDPAQVSFNHVTVKVTPPPGAGPFATNISAGPYAARIGGAAARSGRTPGGVSVIRRTSGRQGPFTISVSPAGGSLAVGKAVSLASVGVLLVVMVGLSATRLLAWVRRRSDRNTTRSQALIYAGAGDDRPSDLDGSPPS